MIGKVIGAFIGDKLGKQTGPGGGASGAAVGVVAATILSRLSIPAMIAVGAGGYVAKKLYDKYEADTAKPTPTKKKSVPSRKARPANRSKAAAAA